MSFHIYIPTYRRTHKQATYIQLPPELKAITTFVCDPTDLASLQRRAAADGSGTQCWVMPPEVKTIADKRAFIIRETPYERIVMLDDDLKFCVKKIEDAVHLIKAKPEEVAHWFWALADKLKTLAHAGFGPRQLNSTKPGGWQDNERMMYVLGYQPQVLRDNCDLGRIETREDFDYALQLLQKGFPNQVCSSICVDQTYNAPGGASLERTQEASDRDAHKLAALHPGLVSVKVKPYKTSLVRTEVSVQWKKAFALSQAAS